ncbi:hypothetical protein QCA50_013884 [Cerrena zonata]|uniref:Uncharacterized protein n=1 Tax=Cerrena zonata TaxID=2478898 RepID=A0AAW0FR10_9APHY
MLSLQLSSVPNPTECSSPRVHMSDRGRDRPFLGCFRAPFLRFRADVGMNFGTTRTISQSLVSSSHALPMLPQCGTNMNNKTPNSVETANDHISEKLDGSRLFFAWGLNLCVGSRCSPI